MISLFSSACIVQIVSCAFPFKAPSGSILTVEAIHCET